MARPRKTVDEKAILELSSKGRTMNEIAAYCNVSVATLERRFAETIKRGRSLMRGSLRSRQYEVAMSGNPTMLVWLGKQELEQTDKAEFTGSVKHEHIDLSHLSNTDLEHVRRLIDSAKPSASHLGREL